jgi:hypothetical protein
MMRRMAVRRSKVTALVALAALGVPALAGAHGGAREDGAALAGKGSARLASPQQAVAAAQLGELRSARAAQAPAPAPAGPCTESASRAMPIGQGHDHKDIAQHRFACRMRQVAFLSLKEELGDRPDVILGEMDVKAGIAAVAITFPRAGVLFFDVKDPARPKFLSRYDGTACDELVTDINCGAFVDLSDDGKTAYMSVQKLSQLPAQPNPDVVRQSGPGVDVIDLSDPRRPLLTQPYTVAGIGGVHTSRSHTIPEGPSSESRPRRPGEYVISNQNGVGIDIAQVTKVGGRRVLTTVRQLEGDDVLATIENNEVHDTFIQNDPVDGRTYLYNAAGFSTGFTVYDITDPYRVRLVAEWDLTPQCTEDWYSHTIDVVHRGGRRYVTMPAELFLQVDTESPSGLAEQSAEEQAKGCGQFVGNGDQAGPLWIVDATDFSKLGPANDLKSAAQREATAERLAKASRDALVATWTNPAGRAAGSLTFTPHNQQVVGDRIYLSHYHGGVFVLDASAAFAGKRERPREIGHIVPSAPETRPLLGQPAGFGAVLGRFFTDFPLGRPEIWDMVQVGGKVLAADMTGGFYSLELDADAPVAGTGRPACRDATAPRATLPARTVRRRAGVVSLRGRATDRGCRATAQLDRRAGKVARVQVAVARRAGKRCRFVTSARGRLGAARSCARPAFRTARLSGAAWSLRLRGLRPGTYVVTVRATDAAGNAARAQRRTVRVR